MAPGLHVFLQPVSLSSQLLKHMNRAYTGVVIAERSPIGSRPLLRFCPVGDNDRHLRLTRLTSGDIGVLAEEELDLSPYVGMMITVVGRCGRNWVYGVNEIRTSSATSLESTRSAAQTRRPHSQVSAAA